MENTNKPIYPLRAVDGILLTENDSDFINGAKPLIGLTKREYFAGLAMQGLISSFTEKAAYGGWGTEIKETVEAAIFYADELLKQLKEKENGNK